MDNGNSELRFTMLGETTVAGDGPTLNGASLTGGDGSIQFGGGPFLADLFLENRSDVNQSVRVDHFAASGAVLLSQFYYLRRNRRTDFFADRRARSYVITDQAKDWSLGPVTPSTARLEIVAAKGYREWYFVNPLLRAAVYEIEIQFQDGRIGSSYGEVKGKPKLVFSEASFLEPEIRDVRLTLVKHQPG